MPPALAVAAWLAIIAGVLKFPEYVYKFVMLLRDTPAEKHEDIVKSSEEAAAKFRGGGRPTWGY